MSEAELIDCIHCGEPHKPHATLCPHCGGTTKLGQEANKNRTQRAVLGALLIFLFFMFFPTILEAVGFGDFRGFECSSDSILPAWLCL